MTLISALLAASPAGAQCLGFQCPPGVMGRGGGGGSVLDPFTQPAAAYSFRKVRSAYAGSAVKLRRVDTTTLDVGFTAGGDFDVAAATAFCTTACTVQQWFDQSGNGLHAANVTAADQPAFIFNCVGALPCARVTTATQGLATASSSWVGKGTTSVVANRSAGTGLCSLAVRGANMLQAYSTPNQWWYSDQAVMAYGWPAAENAWHAGVGTMDGAASAARVDATDVVGTNVPGNAATIASQILIGAAATTCSAVEVIFWNNYATTASERTALVNNQIAYYTPLPLDTFATPAAAYSIRRLKSSYSGPAVRLRRASDNAEADIGFLGYVAGLGAPLDVAAANAHCAATTCTVATWYDQSGNARHVTQATPASQPSFVSVCQNGLPCARTPTNQSLTGPSVTPAAPVTLSAVARTDVVGTAICTFIKAASMDFSINGGAWWLWNGATGFNSGAERGVGHTGIAVANGASSLITLDGGSDVTGNAPVVVTPGVLLVASGDATQACSYAEMVYWNAYGLTAGERVALQANQKSFWGTP